MTTELQSFDARQRLVVNTAGNLRHSEEMIICDRGGERQRRQDSAPGKDGRARCRRVIADAGQDKYTFGRSRFL